MGYCVGLRDGWFVGDFEGREVGAAVGLSVGGTGAFVGDPEGCEVGAAVGLSVGDLVGLPVGENEGWFDTEGRNDGRAEGREVGRELGRELGLELGPELGCELGDALHSVRTSYGSLMVVCGFDKKN